MRRGPRTVQRSAQLMKGMSGAEANAVGGGWEMEEPRCWCSSIEMMLAICSDEILYYMVLRAAGATQDVKSK